MSEELRDKIDKAGEMVSALCKPRGSAGAREWVMTIPARRDHDPDLVIGDGLLAGIEALKQLAAREKRMREVAERLRAEADTIDTVGGDYDLEVLPDLLRVLAKLLEGSDR